MAAADLFARVAKRCPFDPGSGKWMAWIDREMREAEGLDDKALALRREEEDEKRRHDLATKAIREKWARVRQLCKHESVGRLCAEMEPTCQLCGQENP